MNNPTQAPDVDTEKLLDAHDDPLHGLEGTRRDPLEAARGQIAFLEDGLDPAGDEKAWTSLMDEAYRAAHLLKDSVDPALFPNVAKVAAQVQALVMATRTGRVARGPGIVALLRGAARAARESLEAARRGRREPPAAGEAAAAIGAFLSGAQIPPAAPVDLDGPAHYLKIERRRLEDARASLLSAGPAAEAFARVTEEAAKVTASLRELSTRRAALAADLLAAIPEGLAAAARGDAVTEIARGIAERFAGLGDVLAQGEESISRLAARVRETGEAGSRATASMGEVLGRMEGVRVRSVLHGLPASAARAARVPVGEATADIGDAEINASLAPILRTSVTQCVQAMLARAPVSRGSRSRGPGGRKRAARKPLMRLSLTAAESGGQVSVRVDCKGNRQRGGFLAGTLAAIAARLERQGCSLRVEPVRGENAAVSILVPALARAPAAPGRFLVVSAGGTLHAIPSAAVLECVAAQKGGEYLRGGEKLHAVAMGDPAKAAAAVVVKAGRGRSVLLVDELIGEEMLAVAAPGAAVDSASRVREDGSKVMLVDVEKHVRPRRRPPVRRSQAAT